jgi:uncharacterized protein
MRPALRKKDYGDALMAAAETVGDAIAQVKHVALAERLPRRRRPSAADSIPWLVLAGGAALLFWLLRARAPRAYGGRPGPGYGYLPWLVAFPAAARGSWGSRGSGGFGGYDSGDTFGGFGGGDAGGGASSDW